MNCRPTGSRVGSSSSAARGVPPSLSRMNRTLSPSIVSESQNGRSCWAENRQGVSGSAADTIAKNHNIRAAISETDHNGNGERRVFIGEPFLLSAGVAASRRTQQGQSVPAEIIPRAVEDGTIGYRGRFPSARTTFRDFLFSCGILTQEETEIDRERALLPFPLFPRCSMISDSFGMRPQAAELRRGERQPVSASSRLALSETSRRDSCPRMC